MKTLIMAIFPLLLAFSSVASGHGDCCRDIVVHGLDCCPEKCCFIDGDWSLDNYDIDINHSTIYLRPRSRGYNRAKITGDYRLYVNGDQVELNGDQRELVEKFHDRVFDIKDEAKKIAKEGAKLGAAGASLGIQALGSVIRLLSPNYDSDDLEREMEAKASKLEAKAEKLEERAERIEDMADELRELEREMEQKIPELTRGDRF